MAFLGLRKRERVDRQTPLAEEAGGNGGASVPVAEEPGGEGTAMAPQVEGTWRAPVAGDVGTRAPVEAQRAPTEPTRPPVEGKREPVEGTRVPFAAGSRVPVEGTTRGRGLGLGMVGLLILLAGAWAGIVPYVGPTFGYSSHGQPSWQWNLQHSLLYLIPGAVAVVAGLLIIAAAGRVARGHSRIGSGVVGVIVTACGAWLVLGPVVWPLFYSSPVFTSGSAWDNFIYQLGYNLGPGLVLVLLSGIAMGVTALTGRAVTAARPTAVRETPETTWMTRRSA